MNNNWKRLKNNERVLPVRPWAVGLPPIKCRNRFDVLVNGGAPLTHEYYQQVDEGTIGDVPVRGNQRTGGRVFGTNNPKDKNFIPDRAPGGGPSSSSTPLFRVDLKPDLRVKAAVRQREQRSDPAPETWDAYAPRVKKKIYKGKTEPVVIAEKFLEDPNPHFPYWRAGAFRQRLLDKRFSADPEGDLDSAGRKLCAELHPSPCRVADCPYVILPELHPDLEGVVSGETDCAQSRKLYRKARAIVKLLRADQRLKGIRSLPKDFVCGSLRSKVRSIFPPELTVAQELSIKTTAKAEVQPCDACEARAGITLGSWEKARRQPQSVDPVHMEKFKRAFAMNVPSGWDSGKEQRPYVPNGHATKSHSRREGGNWAPEEFSDQCRVELVYSSGKPRVVTLYSGANVEVLTPLHRSLYSVLQRKGWLLVGSPTHDKLRHLSDGCAGETWLSFDYSSATDNIKLEYVRAMVKILKEKSVGLTAMESRCLDVLGELGLPSDDPNDVMPETGQPMGSPMSFPLLCLINKTVVDMALVDLLESGKISFKEWAEHRLLVNGDDLLTKDTSSGGLVAAVVEAGSEAGLVVNKEKTMQSPEYGEINSTVFKNCILQKKTNVSALWMGADVNDVLGFACEATTRGSGLKMVLLANRSRLARQKIKTVQRLPKMAVQVVLSSLTLKHAICAAPASDAPELTNLFPIVTVPDGYDLSREEEAAVLRREVDRVREKRIWADLPSEKKRLAGIRKSIKAEPGLELPGRKIWRLLQPKRKPPRETVLRCFAREWETKRKEALLADEGGDEAALPPSDLSGIGRMIDAIKAWKLTNEKGASGIKASVQSKDWMSLSGNSR